MRRYHMVTHGHGSRRSRGRSCGSAGRAVNAWRISPGRLRGVAAGQDMQLSRETIYRSLFIQTCGVLKKEANQLDVPRSQRATNVARWRISSVPAKIGG